MHKNTYPPPTVPPPLSLAALTNASLLDGFAEIDFHWRYRKTQRIKQVLCKPNEPSGRKILWRLSLYGSDLKSLLYYYYYQSLVSNMLDVLPSFVEPSMVVRLLVAIFGITFGIAWAIWDLLHLAQILMYGSAS